MEEKIIKFRDLYIKNFRNINELHISFKDGITELQAENGVGKTNTLSAILWCLFGKNIFDEKIFVISPIIDCEEKNDITTNVKLVINDNYVISRSYYQRKTTLQTGYLIDDKEELTTITQTNFDKEFGEKFVDIGVFKSLSNINYLPNLHWKDLKDLILKLVGDVRDEEILLKDDFSLIEEQIKLMGIDSTKKSLSDSNKEINQEITKKESEYQTLVNTKEKYVSDSSETAALEEEKKNIQEFLTSVNKKIESNKEIEKKLKEKEKEISDNESKANKVHLNIHALEEEIKSLNSIYDLSATDVNIVKKQEQNYIQEKIDDIKGRIDKLNKQNEEKAKELEQFKKQGEELRVKEIKIESDSCSACGQKLSEEIINRTLENLKKQQIETLNKIKEQYDETKVVIDSNLKEISQKKEELLSLEQELKKIDSKIYDTSENDKQREISLKKANKELQIIELTKELEQLENEHKELEKEKVGSVEVIPDTTDEYEKLNKINEKLATTITLGKINDDIVKVVDELEKLKNNKSSIQKKIELVSKFNNLKSDILREKIKSNFKLTDFKTKEFTQDGIEQETFKICLNGVDYNEMNNGLKILVAIDLISGIQRLKNTYVPIIIDNMESLTSDIEIENTQLIIARATKNKKEIEVI